MSEFDPGADSFEAYGTGVVADAHAIVAQFTAGSQVGVVDVNHGRHTNVIGVDTDSDYGVARAFCAVDHGGVLAATRFDTCGNGDPDVGRPASEATPYAGH